MSYLFQGQRVVSHLDYPENFVPFEHPEHSVIGESEHSVVGNFEHPDFENYNSKPLMLFCAS